MLITDFRKGNAPGVGACLTLASASTYRKIKHARYITYPREKGVYIYGKEREKESKDRPRLYTNRVASTPLFAAGSRRILALLHAHANTTAGKKIEGTRYNDDADKRTKRLRARLPTPPLF